MKRALTLYVAGVTVAAVVALLAAFAHAPPDLSGRVAALAAIFAALAFIAQLAPITVAAKRGIVLDTAVQMAALLALSPGEAALTCAIAALLGNVYRGRAWFNSLFNAAHVTLAVISGGVVYRLLAPASGAGWEGHTRALLAMLCAALVLFVVGELAVDGAIAIQRRARPAGAWWRSHREALLAHAVLATIGIAAAPAIAEAPWLALTLLAPIAALRAALRAAGRADEEAVAVAEAMADAIETRHRALAGKTARLAALANDVARLRGLPEEECRRIVLAARLHDLGAAAMPEDASLTPDSLDSDALAYRRRHQDNAATLIAEGFGLPAVADVVRYHHESYDGLGSPHGLAGVDIPSASRILGLCEAWVTLTAEGGARPALSSAQALTVVRAGAGTLWDPGFVEILARVITTREEAETVTSRRRTGDATPLAAAG